MIRAFIFDWDDTLVQTRQCRFAAIKALASRFYNYELDDAKIERHWGKPFKSLFEALFGSIDDNIDRVIERYIILTAEFPLAAYVDAIQILPTLCDVASVGILTSASNRVVIPDLKHLGFPFHRLTSVQCAEDTLPHKPDPRVFEPILATFAKKGIRVSEVIYVGDCINDFTAALGAGLHFVGICRGTNSLEEFERVGANFIGDLAQLSGYNNNGEPRLTAGTL